MSSLAPCLCVAGWQAAVPTLGSIWQLELVVHPPGASL